MLWAFGPITLPAAPSLFGVTALHAFSASRAGSHRHVELRGHRRDRRQVGLKLLVNLDVLQSTAAIRAARQQNVDLSIDFLRLGTMRRPAALLASRFFRVHCPLPTRETSRLPLGVLLALFQLLLELVDLLLEFQVLLLELFILSFPLVVRFFLLSQPLPQDIPLRLQSVQRLPQALAVWTTQIALTRIHDERNLLQSPQITKTNIDPVITYPFGRPQPP